MILENSRPGRGADACGDFNNIKVSHNQEGDHDDSMTSLCSLDGSDVDYIDHVMNVRTDDEGDSSEQSEHSDEPLTEEMGKTSFLSTLSKKICVSFGCVHIHTHHVTLGVNPAVTTGLPLELEWDHCASESFAIDDYEKKNEGACRRPKRISVSRREAMLREKGHSCSSFTRVSKEILLIQAMRQETKEDMKKEEEMQEYIVLANVSYREYRRVARKIGANRKATQSPPQKRDRARIFRFLKK
jgi:hypothetical protein